MMTMVKKLLFHTAVLYISLASSLWATSTTAAAMAGDENALESWHEHFPALPMPSTLRSLLSPLTPSQATHFSHSAKDGTLLTNATLAHSFCMASMSTCKKQPLRSASDTGTWGLPSATDPRRIDTRITTYFHERDLLPGAILTLNLHNLYPLRPFLPRSIADSLPFSSHSLPAIAHAFSIPFEPGMLTNMQETLQDCEAPEANGERKACCSSLEAMVEFVTQHLGSDVKIMQTSMEEMRSGEGAMAQKLSVVGVPSHRPASAMSVACHNQMYPYMVYYCHQIHDTKVFEVQLQSEDGKEAVGIATCHTNTAHWNPDHVAFRVLKAKPGHTDVCHFVSQSDVLWVPSV